MNFYVISAWTMAAMLVSGPGLAGHCDVEVAEAQAAAHYAGHLEPNVQDAVTVLFEDALEACRQEDERLATGGLEQQMLEPDYLSVGQSMLINIVEMIGAK